MHLISWIQPRGSKTEIFVIFDQLSAIIYGGEPILPVLFNTESCDSLYHYSG
jgi:hypothetical protein